jgi:hypothetical protein
MPDASDERARRLAIGEERHRSKRRTLLAETRLVSEWVGLNYPSRPLRFQFRVGGSPRSVAADPDDEAETRLLRNLNRRVDAVIAPPPNIVMVEGKMWDATTAIGRLMEYRLLLPATPEVIEWGPQPVELVLLTAQHDPIAEILCGRHNIRYVFWVPEWIDEFYAAYPERRRKPTHAGLIDELAKRGDDFGTVTPIP